MMRTMVLTLALLALVLSGPLAAHGQPRPGGPAAEGGPGGPARDRARTFLLLRITEALDLPDDKALAVGRVLRGAEEQRTRLRERRRALEERLQEALGRSPVDAGGLGTLVEEASGVDGELAGLQERTMRDLHKLLTVEQQAKLVLLRPRLQQEIRGAVRRRMMERRGDEGDGERSRRFFGPRGGGMRHGGGPMPQGGPGAAADDDAL